MFDFSGLELLVIVVVALVAIGPKELPGAIRTGMMWMRKTKDLAREFQSGLEELSREAGTDQIERDLEEAARTEELEAVARDFKNDIDGTLDEDTKRILEDPETKKMLAEIEQGGLYGGSPLEEAPGEEPEAAVAAVTGRQEPEKVPEPPPGATGS